MGIWEDHLLPRFIDLTLGTKEVSRHRSDAVVGLEGSVVEVGFGSGLNVPFYPSAIDKVLAVDPSTVGRKLGSKRIEASPIPIEFTGLDGQKLTLADESVDAALSTFTLCTIPNVELALQELLRVLRPGGTMHFLEHGLARDSTVARRQHRLNGLQQKVAGGCNLDRAIDHLVVDAGFEMSSFQNEWMAGPKFLRPWGYLYKGVAIKPAA